jgi:hypothetical protein
MGAPFCVPGGRRGDTVMGAIAEQFGFLSIAYQNDTAIAICDVSAGHHCHRPTAEFSTQSVARKQLEIFPNSGI